MFEGVDMRKYDKHANGYTKVPDYIINAMQGLAYWIGYKKCLYNYYSLSELAIGAEFSSLLQSGANENEIVLCERQYCNFFTEGNIPNDVNKHRMDLTVAELKNPKKEIAVILDDDNKQKIGFLRGKAKVVFEVKLQSSSKSLIKEDFKWLKKIKKANPSIITYMLLVSQDQVPEEFVDDASGHGKRDCQLVNFSSKKRGDPKIHVSKVRYALNSKLNTVQLKSWISQTLETFDDEIDEMIKEQVDFVGKQLLSQGHFVCLIEVV